MLKGLTIPLLIFLTASVLTSVMFGSVEVQFGTTDFFQKHNFFFLIFISFFPRLTLLFSSVPFGGFFWWLGFFFMPRLLVAVLATIVYGKTNPLLVAIAWFVALSGEIMEKKKISSSPRFIFRTYRGGFGNRQQSHYEESKATTTEKGGVIEAEFTKKD